jgi:hypothetical protein
MCKILWFGRIHFGFKAYTLGIRTNEQLAMLARNIQRIYINPEWVANSYLSQCKAGLWQKENYTEALKCWNLEQVLEAEALGNAPPDMLALGELLSEGLWWKGLWY